MNDKAFKTLEYNKIIDMLKQKAISAKGKEKCLELVPMTDLDDINEAQDETTEAVSMILKKGSLPLGGIKDISPSLKRVSMYGTLSIEELLHVGDFLYVVQKAINYAKYENKNDYFELVEKYFSGLSAIPSLEKEISRVIANDKEISDTASNELYDIRRNIKSANAQIKEKLNSIVHSQAYKTMLQDGVVTMRNGRYCVPVKHEHRGNFQGMIHDQSSTGQTLFIEPASVVNLNNKIRDLESKEKNEIDRILRKLSELVSEHVDTLEGNLSLLTYLDFVFAKGELSLMIEGSRPKFNTEGYIDIKKARHPLLSKETVVPIDIYLGKDFTTLLITGPNTGGKTVSLKTLGLFTLMGQSGLHISAFDNSELNVFDNVFADIGDEQSIEQSLSTFSAHMTNIVKILSEINYNSLVLLDELGAGTDPIEGAALAMSILQYLHQRSIRCAVTTHYSELKVYALSTKGVENAACEFDVNSLRPTYRLLIGVPGKSNAFAISKRLGLDDNIINDAREFISQENIKFEDLITDLEISKKTVEIEKDRAEQYRRESEKIKKDLDRQKEKIQNQKDKILNDAKLEAHRLISNAKDEADTLIRQLQKQIKDTGNLKDIQNTRNELRDKLSDKEKALQDINTKKKKLKKINKKLEKGDRVFVHTLNQSGIVVSTPDGSGVMVQAGAMKIKVPISDLSIDETKEKEPAFTNNFTTSVKKGKSQNIKPEIDLRGNMVEEALEKVDKYLDDAYLSGLMEVTIIHGKGTGALRSAIKDFLRTNHHVKSYRLGTFGEGESGVTIVELKS